MMGTKKNVLDHISAGEGPKTEFKSSFNNSVIETLVAFSNAGGGKVFLGVDDNGKTIGVDIGKESIQKLLNEIKIKTEYKVLPDIEVFEIDKKKIVVLSINEYPSKPISFKGRYYKRVNDSNHIMSTDEVVNEYLKVRNRSWDMFLVEDSTLEDLDLEKVVKLIQKINSKREYKIEDDPLLFLKKYGLIQDIKITHAAYLLFSKQELDITEIQIGLFESDTVIKKSVTIKEDLFREVELVMDFIMSHITREFIITSSPEREERWQYPLPALREFVINAIIHRDYRRGVHSQFKIFRDKIELWNIGKLPDELTIKDLYKGNEKSIPRNIKIADIFKEAFLIEKYGSGIKRAVKEIKDYHLPMPVISEIAGGLNIEIFGVKDTIKDTIKDTKKDTLTVSEREALILQKIKENPSITADELSTILNINLRNTKKYLTKLKEQGKIKRLGSRRNGNWELIET
jgi:ATP-dependent DNA helicase RecG